MGRFQYHLHNQSISEEEIREEICSVFKVAFAEDKNFPFKFLHSVGLGSKSLTVPCTSTSFHWTARDIIASVGKGAIYILAEKETASKSFDDDEIGQEESWRYAEHYCYMIGT